jgi:lysozyme
MIRGPRLLLPTCRSPGPDTGIPYLAFLLPLVMLLPLLLTACAEGMPDVYPSPDDFQIHGIDVSKYQGDIDWNAVKASGVRFAWIKATEGGDYVDEKFAQNWALAKEAGVPRGAYHFAYWCRPADEQAAWFTSNVPNDPGALPPVLDVEWNADSKTCPRHVPRDEALATIKTILDAMQNVYGKRPIIYTSIDFYRDVLAGEFTDYPIWVRSVKYYPSVKYGDLHWNFWQHTAQGQVPGISGYVDRNCFYGSASDWQTWLTAAAGE